MEKTAEITLISVVHENDNFNQSVERETERRAIFCAVKNISRSEWAATAHRGLKPAFCVVVWADEYLGEELAILGGNRYGIYRTYQPNYEEIELYLERKGGV